MHSFKGIKYRLEDRNKGRKNVTQEDDKTFVFGFPCINTSDCTPYRLLMSPGKYKFELWGASGGDGRYHNNETMRTDSGGKGAYVTGVMNLIGTQVFYLYIGGKGEDQTDMSGNKVVSLGGFNGGGNGGVDLNDDAGPESSAGGGGATDIRLILGEDLEGYKSRLMIAAGGGGASSSNVNDNHYRSYKGGDGGTIMGNTSNLCAFPGTQINGTFGHGDNGLSFGKEDYNGGGSTGGGGGGYYGAQSIKSPLNYTANPEDDYQESGGAGGSSYISGFDGCLAVDENYTLENPIHSEKSIHYSQAYFTETDMKMKDIDWEGNSGNGYAKITIIDSDYSVPVILTYHKDNCIYLHFNAALVLIALHK